MRTFYADFIYFMPTTTKICACNVFVHDRREVASGARHAGQCQLIARLLTRLSSPRGVESSASIWQGQSSHATVYTANCRPRVKRKLWDVVGQDLSDDWDWVVGSGHAASRTGCSLNYRSIFPSSLRTINNRCVHMNTGSRHVCSCDRPTVEITSSWRRYTAAVAREHNILVHTRVALKLQRRRQQSHSHQTTRQISFLHKQPTVDYFCKRCQFVIILVIAKTLAMSKRFMSRD